MMLIIFVLVVLNVFLVFITRDPPVLREVKKRYNKLRDYIRKNHDSVPEKFWVIEKPVIIVGRDAGDLGYNSNKGYEIGLCIDGSSNDVFHVLLHELSHSTVEEYSHSEKFWKNFEELRDLCANIGLYQRIPIQKEFCGQFIQD